jgi:hypothetical protein
MPETMEVPPDEPEEGSDLLGGLRRHDKKRDSFTTMMKNLK